MKVSPDFVAERVDEVIRRVAGGALIKDAWAAVAGSVNRKTLSDWLRRHPDRRAELYAARKAAFGSEKDPPRLYLAPDFEAVLIFLQSARRGTPWPDHLPGKSTVRRHALANPGFAARLKQIRRGKREWNGVRYSEAGYRAAVDVMRAMRAAPLAAVDAELRRLALPPVRSVREAGERYVWIADGLAELERAPRYTDRQVAAALALVRRNGISASRPVLDSDPALASYDALRERLRAGDDAVRAAFAQARRMMAERMRLQRRQRLPRIAAPSLITGLQSDDLYQAAANLFSRNLPPAIRDDLISQVVMAVLEGEIGRDEIGTKGKALAWRMVRGREMDSLDRTLVADGSISLLDTMSSGSWSFEGAI